MAIIFHITTRKAWNSAAAAGIYRTDTLPAEGFIHCSTLDQVIQVANIRFRSQSGLVLLSIDSERVAAEIIYENLEGGPQMFPHIYGELNTDAVVQVAEFEPGADGHFIMPPPIRDSLEQYQKLAGDLLEAYRSGDPEAMLRIKKYFQRTLTWDELRAGVLRQLGKFADSENRSADISLPDAQLLVARLQGFESWPKLENQVEAMNQRGSLVSEFESAVDAVIAGDVATLERMLRENPELIRARSTRGHHATLLHYVSANGVEDFRQKTPKNTVEVAKILLAAGAEVDAVQADGQSTTLGLVATSVHPLVAGVQIPLMETLLDIGAAVDGAPSGWNPLIAALHNGRGKAAEFLAKRAARLDLEGAAGVGQLDVVKRFFNEDGSLKANATKAQMEAGFMWACEYGRTSVVDFLLENGLEVRLRHNGQTGLHWAAYCAHLDTVKLLLGRKASIDVKDESFGGTPLGWALYGWGEPAPEGQRDNYYDVVAFLVAAGSPVEPEWLANPDREIPLAEKVRADPRMLAALGGEVRDEAI